MKFSILAICLTIFLLQLKPVPVVGAYLENRNITEIEIMDTNLRKIASSLSRISEILGNFLKIPNTNELQQDAVINECDTKLESVPTSSDFVELEFKDDCFCVLHTSPCTKMWNISTTYSGAKIEIELVDLELKDANKCSIKSFKIYDTYDFNVSSNNRPIYASCAGIFSPKNIISKENYIIITAEVKEMTSLPSFKLHHRKVQMDEPSVQRMLIEKKVDVIMAQNEKPKDLACLDEPALLTADNGLLYSPNYQYGKKYPSESSCSWLITVDPGKIIVLSVISFALEQPFPFTHQCFDFVKIYDSSQPDRSKLFGTYCGSDKLRPPSIIRSTTNQMLILFESDEMTNDMGFAAKYAAVSLDPVPIKASSKDRKPSVCGRPAIQPKIYSRIVGGVEATAHSWPWMASLRIGEEHICGAALLNEHWVVTAAHCVIDQNVDLLAIVLGDHNSSIVEGTEEFRNVQKVIIHKDYVSVTSDNDISLLRLDKAATFNQNIQPICLHEAPTTSKLTCVVCGWGRTRNTGPEKVLNQLLVPMIDHELCSSWYRGIFTRSMMCAGYAEGRKDSCQGDSGGPLVCSDGKSWHLAGVTSWGFDCAKPKRPGVYTNVTLFLDWISSNTY